MFVATKYGKEDVGKENVGKEDEVHRTSSFPPFSFPISSFYQLCSLQSELPLSQVKPEKSYQECAGLRRGELRDAGVKGRRADARQNLGLPGNVD
jgi:hypothetical protein